MNLGFLFFPHINLVLYVKEKVRFKICLKYGYILKKVWYIKMNFMVGMFYKWSKKIYNCLIWNLLVRYKLQKTISDKWSTELKNIFMLQCMLRWFQTGPSFTTGRRRVTVLAPAFIMRTILGHWVSDMVSLGPTVISVDMEYNDRQFVKFIKFGIFHRN